MARRLAVLAGLLLVAAPFGVAFGQAADRPAALNRLVECRKLGDDRQRLACYDAAAAALDQAATKGEIVVVDREQAEKVRRQAFGFSLPSLNIFDRVLASRDDDKGDAKGARPEADRPRETADSLTATLAKATQRGDGKWFFELEDGAVWMQTDTEALRKGARKGSTVEIRKTAMGGYFMNVDGQRAIRVIRTR